MYYVPALPEEYRVFRFQSYRKNKDEKKENQIKLWKSAVAKDAQPIFLRNGRLGEIAVKLI